MPWLASVRTSFPHLQASAKPSKKLSASPSRARKVSISFAPRWSKPFSMASSPPGSFGQNNSSPHPKNSLTGASPPITSASPFSASSSTKSLSPAKSKGSTFQKSSVGHPPFSIVLTAPFSSQNSRNPMPCNTSTSHSSRLSIQSSENS